MAATRWLGFASAVDGKGVLQIRQVEQPSDWAGARSLIAEYVAALGVDLSFQGFSEELDNLAVAYARPGGVWLARRADSLVGCVALRPLGDGFGELKRLFVRPFARRCGVARVLVEVALAEARAAQMQGVRLDTLLGMDAAQALYASLGFLATAPYRATPWPGTQFLELVFATDERRPKSTPVSRGRRR